MQNINKEENINKNFCAKFPINPTVLKWKVFGSFLMVLFGVGGLIQDIYKEDLTGIIIMLVVSAIFSWGLYQQIHRLVSYKEICIKDDLFIVKYKNNQIKEYKIKDINRTSHTNMFAMTNNPARYIKMYINGTFLKGGEVIFHHKYNELEEKYAIQLDEIFKEQTKDVR